MNRRYMKDDMRYVIVLLRRVMDLPAASHLQTWMVHFIETIRTKKMAIDWATILSDNLDKQLIVMKEDPHFYMTPYMVYLLEARTTNSLGLYRKGSM